MQGSSTDRPTVALIKRFILRVTCCTGNQRISVDGHLDVLLSHSRQQHRQYCSGVDSVLGTKSDCREQEQKQRLLSFLFPRNSFCHFSLICIFYMAFTQAVRCVCLCIHVCECVCGFESVISLATA